MGRFMTHPARNLYILATAIAVLGLGLAGATLVVPWSWKDTAVFERTYVYLWEKCIEHANGPTYCESHDVAAAVSGGNPTCHALFTASRGLAVAGCVSGLPSVALLLLVLYQLWARPVVLASCASVATFASFVCRLAALLVWVGYAEEPCQHGSTLFPLGGYTWGWFFETFSVWYALLSTVLTCIALHRVVSFKPGFSDEDDPEGLKVLP
eukprot:EG_transcript_13537